MHASTWRWGSRSVMFAVAAWAGLAPWAWQAAVALCLLLPLALLAAEPFVRAAAVEAASTSTAPATSAPSPFAPPSAKQGEAGPFPVDAVLVVALALGWRLSQQAGFADVLPFVPAAVVGGALLTAWALAAKAVRGAAALGAFVAFGGFAAVAFGWADVALDAQAAPPVRAIVTERATLGGRGWPGSALLALHDLRLGPAATHEDWRRLVVPADVFDRLWIGSVACVEEHAGRLGLGWAAVRPCAGDPPPDAQAAARHWLAHVARPAKERPAIAQRLVDGDWRGVDAELSALQHRFEAGAATDVDVESAFQGMRSADPALDAPLAAWLAAAPRSYPALLANALHAQRQVEWLRGAGFVKAVSPAFNADDVREHALQWLDESLPLTTRPSASLIARRWFTGTRPDQREDSVRSIVAANPDDLIARRDYLLWHPLCPCDSRVADDPAMQWLRQGKPSERVRDALAAERLYERGVDAARRGRLDEAERLYTEALAHHPHPQDAYTASINLGALLARSGRVDEGLARLDAAIAMAPAGHHAHDMRGWIHELRREYPQAIDDYLDDAAHFDVDAQRSAARLLLQGAPGVRADPAAAAHWLAEAAHLGDRDARAALRAHPELLALLNASLLPKRE